MYIDFICFCTALAVLGLMKKKLGVIAQLSPTRRVMADELQWIVQELSGDQWKNIGYCRCRDTILERFVTAEVEEAGN